MSMLKTRRFNRVGKMIEENNNIFMQPQLSPKLKRKSKQGFKHKTISSIRHNFFQIISGKSGKNSGDYSLEKGTENVDKLSKHLEGLELLQQRATEKELHFKRLTPISINLPKSNKQPSLTGISGFPSTKSNRKGKLGEDENFNNNVKKTGYSGTNTTVNVIKGRLVCRKYIPRLQRIEEICPEIL